MPRNPCADSSGFDIAKRAFPHPPPDICRQLFVIDRDEGAEEPLRKSMAFQRRKPEQTGQFRVTGIAHQHFASDGGKNLQVGAVGIQNFADVMATASGAAQLLQSASSKVFPCWGSDEIIALH